MCVFALGFLHLNLIYPKETRAVVYKALFGPRFRVCGDCFDPLSDRRSWCLSLACGLWYSQSRVGDVESRLFRAARNTETGFSEPFLLTYNSLAIFYQIGCLSGQVGSRFLSVSTSECLFRRFQLDLWFWLKMFHIAETFVS